MINQISWIIFSIPSLLIASSIHEFAHAYTAYRLGDYTAKIEGRMTLNPLAHIDPIGTLMMIVARIGWSKPVPVNEYNFKNPVLGTALTSFAGPASNLVTAVITAIPIRLISGGSLDCALEANNFFVIILLTFLIVNLSLALFNLIPLPPLDGHKIVRAFLPKQIRYYWEELEKFGRWILIFAFLPFSPLSYLLTAILNAGVSILMGILVY